MPDGRRRTREGLKRELGSIPGLVSDFPFDSRAFTSREVQQIYFSTESNRLDSTIPRRGFYQGVPEPQELDRGVTEETVLASHSGGTGLGRRCTSMTQEKGAVFLIRAACRVFL